MSGNLDETVYNTSVTWQLCPTTLAPRAHAVGIMWRHGAIFVCAIHIILAVLIVRAARRARSTSTRQTVKTRAQAAAEILGEII